MKTAVHASTDKGSDLQSLDLDAACTKRSFLKLPVAIDTARLLQEFGQIPEAAWGVSHWDVHCSIDVLLLRGGSKGKAEDFLTKDVANSPLLNELPYISSLLAPEGPFGGAVYAFMFRTKPKGITRVHDDGHEVWKKTVRIHIPIVTNDGAFLIAEERAKHLSVGEAWTFDNQSQHSVVNGDSTRVHLIFDVNPNPKLAELMTHATFDPGVHDPERWALTIGPRSERRVPPLMFAIGEPMTASEKNALGLNPDGFATRIVRLGKKGTLLLTPLKRGDIVTAVNGVGESVLSRTALDHVRLKHEPGETVTLEVLRGGRKTRVGIHLKPDHYFSPSARLAHLLQRFGLSFGKKEKSEY
jgi:hypothetical protein